MTREEKQASFDRARATPYVRKEYGEVNWRPPRHIPEAMKLREGRGPDFLVYCRLTTPKMQFHARVQKVCAYCESAHYINECPTMKRELRFGEEWFLFHREVK